jgi:3-oxoacyl-[acyl-carrier protein] reductase
MTAEQAPVALVTGVGRHAGIGAAVARRLAAEGWDVALSWWHPYDRRVNGTTASGEPAEVADAVRAAGRRALVREADLERPGTPAELLAAVEEGLGPVRALVLSHCESVDSDLRTTTVESFDRHMAVNARATWLLVREFAERFRGPHGSGRIVGLTSDHTAGNLPYGASKGALDRIVLAAARELADLGVSANVVNPGPTDTGWMTPELRDALVARTPLGRIGRPDDAAALVAFLCSPAGGWVDGQLLHSDGGLSAP